MSCCGGCGCSDRKKDTFFGQRWKDGEFNPVYLKILELPHALKDIFPYHQSNGAAGADLSAAFLDEMVVLEPSEWTAVPTGIAIAIPDGYEGQIRPRSSMLVKRGLHVAFGTVDCDYRGELFVTVLNVSKEKAVLKRGERIAQLVIAPVQDFEWERVKVLPETERGEGRHGSTGS